MPFSRLYFVLLKRNKDKATIHFYSLKQTKLMNKLKNKVQLIGNLGTDPEVKVLESGKSLARLSLATHEIYRNTQGDKVQETQWHNLIAWGKTAEFVKKHLK